MILSGLVEELINK